MVRLKNRWLVVRVDEARHVAPPVGVDGPNKRITTLPSKRDLFMLLSDGVIENFGITHCGALRDSKVQLRDNVSRLVLIKTSRALAPKVRTVLTFVTSLSANGGKNNVPSTLSVISEHGSLRTTKRSMITKLREAYREHLQRMVPTAPATTTEKERRAVGQSLQNVLQELHAIDF